MKRFEAIDRDSHRTQAELDKLIPTPFPFDQKLTRPAALVALSNAIASTSELGLTE